MISMSKQYDKTVIFIIGGANLKECLGVLMKKKLKKLFLSFILNYKFLVFLDHLMY